MKKNNMSLKENDLQNDRIREFLEEQNLDNNQVDEILNFLSSQKEPVTPTGSYVLQRQNLMAELASSGDWKEKAKVWAKIIKLDLST